MKLFLSWSGNESEALATLLHEWLKTVLPFADPWMSSEDIAAGSQWTAEMKDQLQKSSFCIVCVTPGVQSSPWVNFEAGAISKSFGEPHVSPLLLGVSPRDLNGFPLSMFQCVSVEREEIQKLLESVNNAAESKISNDELAAKLNHTWPWFNNKINCIHDGIVAYRTILKSIEAGGDQGLLGTEVALRIKKAAGRVKDWLVKLQQDGLVVVVGASTKGTHQRYSLSKEGQAYLGKS